MGYTTDFAGALECTPALSPAQRAYLVKFSDTRRMYRDADLCAAMPDPEREAVQLPVGEHGEYFVGGGGFAGQDRDRSITEYNSPPPSQPGLWCQWVPDESGSYIGWNGGEKFYSYVEWLQYLIDHFLTPWRVLLNGNIRWFGEEDDDRGVIEVNDSVVTTFVPEPVTMPDATHTDVRFD